MTDKERVKAWLFLLLSQVESQEIEDAELNENGKTITVKIKFKKGK